MSATNTLTLVNQLCYWRWNKILPAVYDDSLSQYELLCKIIQKCNEIIAQFDNIKEIDDAQNAAIEEIIEKLRVLYEGGLIEIYEEQILSWIEQNLAAILREHMGIVYPAVDAEGRFVLYSATVMGLSWDVLVTPDDDFGRIVIKY